MEGGGKNNFVSSFLISHTGFILTDRVLGESERERDWEFERERERLCVREREIGVKNVGVANPDPTLL